VRAFVDADTFVRVLTGDDPQKAARSLALLQRAKRGDVRLITSESVIAEVAYVLASRSIYRVPRPSIAVALLSVLADPSIELDHKESVLAALDLWQGSNLDFTDCLAVEHVRRAELAGSIYSHDRDFDCIPGIHRLEP
jgi:predicted nucleic acid-binding protein